MNNTNMSDGYKDKVICRGDFRLGTACGRCAKCLDFMANEDVSKYGSKVNTTIRTDNSAVIANMQNTIHEKDALIEQMREGLLKLSLFNFCDGNAEHLPIIEKALALSPPISEKAK